jgi:hypothetical protein
MSQANAAARKRRAGGASLQDNGAPVQNNNNQLGQPPKNGLTLPQVISLVDKRLITLETFMKDSQGGNQQIQIENTGSVSEDAVNQLADEFNSKFEMLAQELAELKDVVMKLQTYTMDVNKTLFEERVHVLSDMGNKSEPVFDLSEDDEIIINAQ